MSTKFLLAIYLLALPLSKVFSQSVFPTNGDKVGIGTSTPSAMLDLRAINNKPPGSTWHQNIFDLKPAEIGVGGGISFGGFKTGISSFGLYAAIAGIKENDFSGDEAGAFIVKTTENANSGFIERLRVSSNGYVGVGSTNPLATLHIGQFAGSGVNHVDSKLILEGKNVFSGGVHYGSYGQLLFSSNNNLTGNARRFLLTNAINGSQFGIVRSVDANTTPTIVGTNGNSISEGIVDFSISNNGNIGIGTTDARGYKLAVAGNIIAESVEVKPQTNWPDYVFNPDYQLMPLEDLKIYLDKNKHLPEIPSSHEVQSSGSINLGDMNARLLKKIEELTLYLLLQHDELQSQKEIIKQLMQKQEK